MKINAAGLDLIKRWEGLRLTAYKDAVGIWTIGYGHTAEAGPPAPKAGMKITDEEAEDILKRDLRQYERAVTKAISIAPTSNQFAAMTSLCFNIGPGNFAQSSVVRLLNAGKPREAADAFLLWNKAGGKVLKGLTARREDEKKLFLTRSV
jgi:lysozyme